MRKQLNENGLVKIVSTVISAIILVSPCYASRLSHTNVECGLAVNGLQLCLAGSGSNLHLTFANVGERDVTLNLGIMLGNGKLQSPTQNAIKFSDGQGKVRRFQFYDKRYSGVGGQVDDYLVPLPMRSTYTLQLSLDQFWCQETKEFS